MKEGETFMLRKASLVRRISVLAGAALVATTLAFTGATAASAATDTPSAPPSGSTFTPPAPEYVLNPPLTPKPGTDALKPGAAAAACSTAVDIGYTILSGTTVKGQGSWTRCNTDLQRVIVNLWRSSWYNSGIFYQEVIHDNNPANYGSWIDNVQKSCAGSGLQQWYTTIDTYNLSGTLTAHKQSNTLLVNC